MNVYENCPEIQNERFLVRLIDKQDCDDLLKVYSDPKAVPLFNSDNCHGDNFCYRTPERMMQAIEFWIYSYNNGYFVRWSIIDRQRGRPLAPLSCFSANRWMERLLPACFALICEAIMKRPMPLRICLA